MVIDEYGISSVVNQPPYNPLHKKHTDLGSDIELVEQVLL